MFGKIVKFHQGIGAADQIGIGEHPAIVTHEWTTCLNLMVMFDNGVIKHITSVPQQEIDQPNNYGYTFLE